MNIIPTELLWSLIGAVVNGAVTWGVVSTKLAWMRADIARMEHGLEVALQNSSRALAMIEKGNS